MDELQKAVRLGMGDSVTAAKVVADFRRQCVEWGCALPDVQFLVSDFGLNDFYRTGLVEAWIANETKAGCNDIYSMVFNNFWDTNFAGNQFGLMEFRYDVFAVSSDQDERHARRMAQSFAAGLVSIVQCRNLTGEDEK